MKDLGYFKPDWDCLGVADILKKIQLENKGKQEISAKIYNPVDRVWELDRKKKQRICYTIEEYYDEFNK